MKKTFEVNYFKDSGKWSHSNDIEIPNQILEDAKRIAKIEDKNEQTSQRTRLIYNYREFLEDTLKPSSGSAVIIVSDTCQPEMHDFIGFPLMIKA